MLKQFYYNTMKRVQMIVGQYQQWPPALGVILVCIVVATGCGHTDPTPTPTPQAPTVKPLASPTATAVTALSPIQAPSPLQLQSPLSTVAVDAAASTAESNPPVYTYEVVSVYPHDPDAFTQGLLFDEGILYEGTGLYGHSSVRQVDLESGKVKRITQLSDQYFGEGIVIVGDRLLQLTWREETGFSYDKNTFALLAQFSYPTEGWGITFDGQELIMSDGTAWLYRWDPETLAQVGAVEVHDGTTPVVRLNELEYVKGEIFANIWQTDLIARIDPATGKVVGWIDLTGLLDPADRLPGTDVLNGIAYLPTADRLFVTGKRWPKLFEIRLIPKAANS
ncbi:MAG: glutaminyl-peptide cyclotransferase [Caldilineaceae bacterium]